MAEIDSRRSDRRGEGQPPVPAATVALMRESDRGLETLLLQRNTRLVFHGGHWVFPGGRIDSGDYPQQEDSRQLFHAAQAAAVRETAEEAGIVLVRDELIHTAHWTTPPNLPRRFSTWFFVCPVSDSIDVCIDDAEIKDYRWISPAGALELAVSGEIVLPRPTKATLLDLNGYRDLGELRRGLAEKPIRVFPDPSPFYQPDEMGLP